jgi:wyosine [tRNA(Phe)-imidazoG37] synthetase (radical SAM superfamily)
VPLSNIRAEYFPRQEILAEVREALSRHSPGAIDWVTLVGSGETTLHAGLGWIIRQIRAITSIPVAVITNGSLLHLEEVRQDLLAADAVLSTLDAGNPALYRRINRPWPELSFELLVDGLVEFRRQYSGMLWIEVMLMQGINDSEEQLFEIASILSRIRPDQVHVSVPSRPPAETDVKLPENARLLRASEILGNRALVIQPSGGSFDLSGFERVEDAVVAIVSRHPMQEEELLRALERWTPGQVDAALGRLASSGQVQIVERHGGRFWSAAGCHYPPAN